MPMRPTPGPTDTWAEEFAKELADQLEGWALEREKVIDRLDVHAARVARSLMRSLRVIARALAASANEPDTEERREIMSRLISLRKDAKRLMTDGPDAIDASAHRAPGPQTFTREIALDRGRPDTLSPPPLLFPKQNRGW